MRMQEEAREAVASPVEAIADSLDEEAAVDGEGGGKLASAIRGEFGEYDFDDAQLQVRFAAGWHEPPLKQSLSDGIPKPPLIAHVLDAPT